MSPNIEGVVFLEQGVFNHVYGLKWFAYNQWCVLEDKSLASRRLEDTIFWPSPWPRILRSWPWPRPWYKGLGLVNLKAKAKTNVQSTAAVIAILLQWTHMNLYVCQVGIERLVVRLVTVSFTRAARSSRKIVILSVSLALPWGKVLVNNSVYNTNIQSDLKRSCSVWILQNRSRSILIRSVQKCQLSLLFLYLHRNNISQLYVCLPITDSL